MKDGVININKPSGWTSQDVCSRLRRRLRIRKTGHTGTLDPMATGVLPVCIGKATRIIEYYDNDHKTYHACMKLGVISDTLDVWGDTETRYRVRITSDGDSYAQSEEDISPDTIFISEDSIYRAFEDYTGVISQIPPKYSALRINGKRAYDLARQGADFEIKPREITILSNEITRIDRDAAEIEFDVTCSKGTYIRTICDDIGRTLGCGAVMSALTRTKSGCFSISGAVDIDTLTDMSDEDIEDIIIPMENTLTELGTVLLDDNRVIAFMNGNSSSRGYRITEESRFGDNNTGAPVYKVFSGESFLGTASVSRGQLIPAKVILR